MDMSEMDVATVTTHWAELAKAIFVPNTESEYWRLVAFLDQLVDEVGEDDKHPLASLMEVVGFLIEHHRIRRLRQEAVTEWVKTANKLPRRDQWVLILGHTRNPFDLLFCLAQRTLRSRQRVWRLMPESASLKDSMEEKEKIVPLEAAQYWLPIPMLPKMNIEPPDKGSGMPVASTGPGKVRRFRRSSK
jgi:HTH-type transcriptional regulator / antitoxin HigA